MAERNSNILMIFLLLLIFSATAFSQGKLYEGPDDPAGDPSAIREGYMTGNRVYLYYQNTTELSYCCGPQYSKWPNNDEGMPMTDGVALLIGARVFVTQDSIPVTDPAEIASRNDLDTLYFVQTSYREETDHDPTGTIEWGLAPVPGYDNELNEYVAMSNRPDSWPRDGWPATGNTTKWPGEWDGRFGRGVIYADLETYFVANDAQDQEYLQPGRTVKYYPRPGLKIGDKNPNVTKQFGDPWGGLGIRVEVRGFQWNNPQARDAIFWEYTIANTSDYDVNDVAFGYWVDNGIGGNSPYDDLGYFNKLLDMSYSWDIDGIGDGGLKTGVMGFAYLESPGSPNDGIDNDDDGLIDEKRDNIATAKVGPTAGISDLNKFLDYYSLTEKDLKEHWDADEDQDWKDGDDENGDGVYQQFEDYGDDVGLDGVGPLDLNYHGPDADGTECNHKPDYKEGVGCEPNFAATDVTESDMIGLTEFQLFQVPGHSSEKGWFRDDKGMWEKMNAGSLEGYSGDITNLVEFFASAPFILYKGRTERISMSLVFAYDALEGLNSAQHTAPVLYRNKAIVQAIYNSDYRFAQPPKMPTLKAYAGDGKVILTWDDMADKYTRDPFVQNANDFEGYKLYRATDKNFADPEVITDGYGTPMFKKPIYQCDKIDGIEDFADFGLINGQGYYLGSDNGITHYFVDNNIQNGRTYYYGLVAYDYGVPDLGAGVTPSENNLVIELDEAENIRHVGKNVQVVVPHQPAAGYSPPNIDFTEGNGVMQSGATVIPEIIDPSAVVPDHVYKVKFQSEVIDNLRLLKPYRYQYDELFTTDGYKIYDVTLDSLLYEENPDNFTGTNIYSQDGYYYFDTTKAVQSELINGFRVSINQKLLTAKFDPLNSGWVVGDAPIEVDVSKDEAQYFPWQYDIVFTDNDTAYTGLTNSFSKINFTDGSPLGPADLLLNQSYNFYVLNKTFPDSSGNYDKMDLITYDVNHNGVFDRDSDYVLVGPVVGTKTMRWAGTIFGISFAGINSDAQMPKKGDIYRVDFKRPLSELDSVMFKVNPEVLMNKSKLKEDMNQIKVVPNPYVATNMMEPAVSNSALNQRREILFTHIPASCTIKIFTSSAVLVDEIKVDNAPNDGIVHWDLLTKEGLEAAAGMYIYHVKSNETGDEKIGKFAILK